MFKKVKSKLGIYMQNEQLPLLLLLIVLCALLTFFTPVFFTFDNMMNILRAASLVAITGVGMLIVILVGEIDLSVGSTYALSGVTGAAVLSITNNFFLALVAVLLLGILIGALNAFFVVKGKVNSLIATMGSMAIIRGVTMVTTQARSIQVTLDSFVEFGTGYWGPFPKPLVIAIVLIVLVGYILKHTSFGRYIYAVGGNSNAAKLAGIAVGRIKFIAYMIVGVLASLSGFISAARMNSGQPTAGNGFEMEVISAVIFGGASLNGGRGTLLGAMTGVLILSVLQNGLVLMQIDPFYHNIVRGAVIIFAVFIDERRKEGLTKILLKAKSQQA